jgi:hypothetical protein
MPSDEANRERQRRAEKSRATAEGFALTPEEKALVPSEIAQAAAALDQLASTLEAGGKYDQFDAADVRGLANAVRVRGDAIGRGRAARERLARDEADTT